MQRCAARLESKNEQAAVLDDFHPDQARIVQIERCDRLPGKDQRLPVKGHRDQRRRFTPPEAPLELGDLGPARAIRSVAWPVQVFFHELTIVLVGLTLEGQRFGDHHRLIALHHSGKHPARQVHQFRRHSPGRRPDAAEQAPALVFSRQESFAVAEGPDQEDWARFRNCSTRVGPVVASSGTGTSASESEMRM